MADTPPYRRPRWRLFTGLRAQLLVVSLGLVSIPFMSFLFIQEVGIFLRKGEENAALALAQAVATVLNERPELFSRQTTPPPQHADRRQPARAFTVKRNIRLDGKPDDWGALSDMAKTFGAPYLIEKRGEYSPKSHAFRHVLAIDDRYLYALFLVTDDTVTYRESNALRLNKSDHLRIAFLGADGRFHVHWIAASRPGWVNAYKMPTNNSPIPSRPELTINGTWHETNVGYNLEIRIPRQLVSNDLKVSFSIADVDDRENPVIRSLIGTQGEKVEDLGAVVVRSVAVERILKGLQSGRRERIWVVDTEKRVLAITGSLQQTPGSDKDDATDPIATALPAPHTNPVYDLLRTLYRKILTQPARHFHDDLAGASRLEGEEIKGALKGKGSVRWRLTEDEKGMVLTAAHPVFRGDGTLGAVVVERPGDVSLAFQNRAMENLFNTTLVAFLSVVLGLFFYATLLSVRIRRLRDQTAHAVDLEGRIHGDIDTSRTHDELGDLSRAFATLIDQLKHHTRYLETLGSRLSHELRTPLAVVKSSLEIMEMEEIPDAAKVYADRARGGVRRLDRILNALSEASRLERSLDSMEWESFDMRAVISGCLEGYRAIHPDWQFDLTLPKAPLELSGAPDLIAQMMDKLISNAVDFAPKGSTIRVDLSQERRHLHLRVGNDGPLLPQEMPQRLFDSMVSLRKQRGEQPHLGMGLFIVRLVTERHGGRVQASNREDGSGVEFRVTLPMDRQRS
ncbi:MAG: proteobacterial dedicated sortase system histidine kinase [Magnetococcales bacterium]|nr:proteobacterial dedicated sortase system histidine kinase [Magnetococcales bacterium]